MVSPEIDAVTPESIWNTRLVLSPLTVTPAVGPVIVCVPPVLVSSSWLPSSVMVCERGENRRIKRDCDRAGELVRQAHGPGQGQIGRGLVDRSRRRLDDKAHLEGAKVDHRPADQAALVGRDPVDEATPAPMAELLGKSSMVWVSPP